MSDISLFNKLPDCVVDDSYLQFPSPVSLDSVLRKDAIEENETIPVDYLTLPTETDDINDNNESDTSQIINDEDDDIESLPVNECVKPYLMKGGIFNLQNSNKKHSILIRNSIQERY